MFLERVDEGSKAQVLEELALWAVTESGEPVSFTQLHERGEVDLAGDVLLADVP